MRFLLVATCTVAFFSTVNAWANPSEQTSEWKVSVGGGVLYGPVYQGADTYQLSAYPDIRVQYGDRFSASVPDGIRYDMIKNQSWVVGPQVKYDFGRDEDGNSPFRIYGDGTDDLLGLGDVDGTVEVGGFAEFYAGAVSAKVSLRQGLNGHEGLIGEVELKYGGRIMGFGPPVIFSIGPEMQFAGGTYTGTYYGVDTQQALDSGLPEFESGGGIVSIGFGASGIVPLTKRISLIALAGFDHLTGDVAASPLVEERGTKNNGSVGLFLSYDLGL